VKIWIKAVLVLLVATVAWLAWQAGKVMPMGAAYIAKTMCSEHFVAGRDNLDDIWSDILDIDSSFTLGNYELDTEAARVTGFFGSGILKTTAVYREGLGCTIAAGVAPDSLLPLPPEQLASSGPVQPWPDSAASNPKLEAALDEAFSEPSSESHRQTRAVVLLQDGQIVAERYAAPFDRETPLIGWSMTKSITNNLLGLLAGDGHFDLDDPAPVPEWQADDDPRKAITMRQMLQMSSGLDFPEVYSPGSATTNMLFTEPSAAAVAAAAPLGYEPGSRWHYSSGTSNILARIVRDMTGGTAAAVHEFTRRRLYNPLGITTMVIEPDASGAQVGSSFSYATARDWARLGQFWLQDGMWRGERLLPEGWMDWSTVAAPAATEGQYGAQFWLNRDVGGKGRPSPELPESMFMANGFNGQSVVVFPDQNIVVVRLGFTTDNSWDLDAFLVQVLTALDL
jgi:CubicO group peptidase (beta-lactamase class C family)